MEDLKAAEEIVRHVEACVETSNGAAIDEALAVIESRVEDGDREAVRAVILLGMIFR